jgi:hypothetical protein
MSLSATAGSEAHDASLAGLQSTTRVLGTEATSARPSGRPSATEAPAAVGDEQSTGSAARGLVARGVERKRRGGVQGHEAATSIRAEIAGAIDESLARHRARGLSAQEAYACVEVEAQKMVRSAAAAEERDDEACAHNRRMRSRETLFSVAGVFCLVFPILLIFDAATVLALPENFRTVLEMGAQEESLFGKTALYAHRVTLWRVRCMQRPAATNKCAAVHRRLSPLFASAPSRLVAPQVYSMDGGSGGQGDAVQ